MSDLRELTSRDHATLTPIKTLLDGFRRKRTPPPGWLEKHAPAGTLDPIWATANAHDLLSLWVWWSIGGERDERALIVALARELVATELPNHIALSLLDRWLAGEEIEAELRAGVAAQRERRLPEDNDDENASGTRNTYVRDLVEHALETPFHPRSITGAYVAASHARDTRGRLNDAHAAKVTELVRTRLPCPPLAELLDRTLKI